MRTLIAPSCRRWRQSCSRSMRGVSRSRAATSAGSRWSRTSDPRHAAGALATMGVRRIYFGRGDQPGQLLGRLERRPPGTRGPGIWAAVADRVPGA